VDGRETTRTIPDKKRGERKKRKQEREKKNEEDRKKEKNTPQGTL